MNIRWYSGVVLVGILAACASVPIPTKQLTDAKTTIRAAKRLGAAAYPDSQGALDRAREGVYKGEQLIKEDELEKATRVLERATVDAELALALARQAIATDEAKQAEQQLQTMEQTP
jgi:hypothetical protein